MQLLAVNGIVAKKLTCAQPFDVPLSCPRRDDATLLRQSDNIPMQCLTDVFFDSFYGGKARVCGDRVRQVTQEMFDATISHYHQARHSLILQNTSFLDDVPTETLALRIVPAAIIKLPLTARCLPVLGVAQIQELLA